MNKTGNNYNGFSNVEGGNIFDNSTLENLRENFKMSYATQKGWNPNQLTVEQLAEIKSQPGYIQPGLIKG